MTREDIRTEIANNTLAVLRWLTATKAEVECPGASEHTQPGGTAVLDIDRVTTIYCHHQSCKRTVAEANSELRKLINRAERRCGLAEEWTQAEMLQWKEKQGERERERLRLLRIQAHAETKLLPAIVEAYRRPLVEFARESPVSIIGTHCVTHRRMFLEALKPFENERWWSAPGAKDHGGGKKRMKRHFNCVGDMIANPSLLDRYVAPADFCDFTYTRMTCAVRARRILVVELDTYSNDTEEQKEVCCAIGQWLECDKPEWGMKLFAIIDAGNKSAHCWMTWPTVTPEEFKTRLVPTLVGMKADPAFASVSHTFRAPGVPRLNGRNKENLDEFDLDDTWTSCAWQKLIYLNPDVVQDYAVLPTSVQTHGETYDPHEVVRKQSVKFAKDNDNINNDQVPDQRSSTELHKRLRERENL